GLDLDHKHLPEMQLHGRLACPPLFVPSVGRFAQGMLVQVALSLWALPGRPAAEELHAALAESYKGRRFVSVAPFAEAAKLARLATAPATAGSMSAPTRRGTRHCWSPSSTTAERVPPAPPSRPST